MSFEIQILILAFSVVILFLLCGPKLFCKYFGYGSSITNHVLNLALVLCLNKIQTINLILKLLLAITLGLILLIPCFKYGFKSNLGMLANYIFNQKTSFTSFTSF